MKAQETGVKAEIKKLKVNSNNPFFFIFILVIAIIKKRTIIASQYETPLVLNLRFNFDFFVQHVSRKIPPGYIRSLRFDGPDVGF